MEKQCDLHIHSTFSDGTYTPSEIIDLAVTLGLSAIALTDHNTAEGLPHFLSAAKDKPIEAIPGVEFSVDFEGKEIHLLGLFLNPKSFSQIDDLMADVVRRKEISNRQLIDALKTAGISLDYDKIKRNTESGRVNRAHIAAELTRLGHTQSVIHAFDTLLHPSYGYYKEPKRLSAWEMLDFLHSIDAVSVLAHPFLNLTEQELLDFLPQAKAKGLCGMECHYSMYDEDTTQKSLELVNRFGLKPSGGSDFHGTIKPHIELGIGQGNLKIPYAWASDLKNN